MKQGNEGSYLIQAKGVSRIKDMRGVDFEGKNDRINTTPGL